MNKSKFIGNRELNSFEINVRVQIYLKKCFMVKTKDRKLTQAHHDAHKQESPSARAVGNQNF